MSSCMDEGTEARRWLARNCHASHIKHVIERGLDYFEAVERAGLCTQLTSGEDLNAFLTDDDAAINRSRYFVQPTL